MCNQCSNCGKSDLPIVNKKYALCPICNSIRLHGKTPTERAVESQEKYKEKSLERFRNKIKKETDLQFAPNLSKIRRFYKPIKQQTSKESDVKSKLSQIKFSIELEAVQNNEYYCRGCGISHPGLDKSHILSVGQFKALELIKENIQLLCRKCHMIWESGTIDEKLQLNCFVDNVTFIFLYDTVTFNTYTSSLEQYLNLLIPDVDKKMISRVNWAINSISENINKCV